MEEEKAKPIGQVLEALKPRFISGEKVESVSSGLCKPDCQVCGGIGYVRNDVPINHPDFGKLFLCPKIDVSKLPGADRYGLYPEELSSLEWGAIYPLQGSNSIKASRAVRDVLSRGWGWVYLYGDHGQAKTLILKIAVAEALRNNQQAAYANMAEIMSHMRKAFDSKNPNYEAEARLEWWSRLPILAIDEFDRINSTEWAKEQRFLLMDDRQVAALRRQSVTLIASNAHPMELDSWYRDRILDGRFQAIELRGPSARLGMTEEDMF